MTMLCHVRNFGLEPQHVSLSGPRVIYNLCTFARTTGCLSLGTIEIPGVLLT